MHDKDSIVEFGLKEQVDDGIAPERVILAGFSQGGAVVLEASCACQ